MVRLSKHQNLDYTDHPIHAGIEGLTPYALREPVSAISVDAQDKESGKRTLHIQSSMTNRDLPRWMH